MKKLTAIFLALLLLTAAFIARADDWPPPSPFSIISEDETRIFFFNPGEWSDWLVVDTPEDFPSTGLYYNTNPPTLIYLVENPTSITPWRRDFIFSADMYYLVTIPQMNLSRDGVAQSTALVFYRNGAIIREYTIGELIKLPFAVAQTTTTAQWVERSSISGYGEPTRQTLCCCFCMEAPVFVTGIGCLRTSRVWPMYVP